MAERVASEFPSSPVVLKDYVKSRKQDWFDACYIPDPRDAVHVKQVVRRFLELTDLAGGLVFRQFENFKKVGTHPKTRMPLSNEWRGFMCHGKLIYRATYWDPANYSDAAVPDASVFEGIARRAGFLSSFFSLDVAEKEDNTWMPLEINSGGASGVPEGGGEMSFYKRLSENVSR